MTGEDHEQGGDTECSDSEIGRRALEDLRPRSERPEERFAEHDQCNRGDHTTHHGDCERCHREPSGPVAIPRPDGLGHQGCHGVLEEVEHGEHRHIDGGCDRNGGQGDRTEPADERRVDERDERICRESAERRKADPHDLAIVRTPPERLDHATVLAGYGQRFASGQPRHAGFLASHTSRPNWMNRMETASQSRSG